VSPSGLKRLKSVLVAVAALALLAGPVANAKTTILEHNVEHFAFPFGTDRNKPSGYPCMVKVQHGNAYGAAYAKIKADDRSCTFFRVNVTALQNGKLVRATTFIKGPVPGRWYQATVPYANIVGSKFYAGDDQRGGTHWSYSAL
jgi:hypothetical protein